MTNDKRYRQDWPRRDEATGAWWFIVDVGIDARNGRRRQVRRVGFATKKDAQAELTRLMTAVQEGSHIDRSTTTLGKYLDSWLIALPTAGLRANTITSYERTLRRYVIPRIGGIRLQTLTAIDLDRLYGELLTTGRADGTGLSPRTVRYAHVLITSALGDAERKGLVVRSVARAATPPSAQLARREMRTWTADELSRFLDHIREQRWFALFRVLSMTGIRRGELCGLRWIDVDLDAARLAVRQSLTTKDYAVILGEPKTSRGRRSLDLDPETVATMRAWKAAQNRERLLLGPGWENRLGLVFTLEHGAPIHPNTVGKVFDTRVKSAGVPKIRLHDVRHTHATLLLAAGANAKVVSERLGHSSVAFTLDTYAHAMPGQQADAAAAVARLVDGAK